MNRFLLISLAIMAVLACIMTVLQIWTSIIGWDIYIKAMLTLGALAVLDGLLIMVFADMGSKKKMRDENYID